MKSFKYVVTILSILIITACNNDDDNSATKTYVPTLINILKINLLGDAENLTYSFTYNQHRQITLIDYQRTDADGTYRGLVDIAYKNNRISQIITTDLDNDTRFTLHYQYDDTGIINSLQWEDNSGTISDIDISYNLDTNTYLLKSTMSSYFPVGYQFNATNQLIKIDLNSDRIIEYNNTNNQGVFANLTPQIPLVLWFDLMFRDSDLYFFSQLEIKKIDLEFCPDSTFTDLERDAQNNLISYKVNHAVTTANHAVHYELK